MKHINTFALVTLWSLPLVHQAVAAPPAHPNSPTAELSETSRLRTVRLRILGMKSAACPALVRAAVSRLPGIEEIDPNLKTKTVRIVFDAEQISVMEIQRAIEDDAGFDSAVEK